MPVTNVEQARFNMVQQQIRPWEVLDQRVLDVLTTTPREAFVPEPLRALAFSDLNIPLSHNQVMMPPKLEGRLLQSLNIQSGDSVLEIGTGSAYLTACLARLGGTVLSVDIHADFQQQAQSKLEAQDIGNVVLQDSDAALGWSGEQQFDVVAVTGSLPQLHQGFHRNLSIGGRLFVIVGQPPIMEALLITRVGKTEWSRKSLFDTSVPPLEHAEQPEKFVF